MERDAEKGQDGKGEEMGERRLLYRSWARSPRVKTSPHLIFTTECHSVVAPAWVWRINVFINWHRRQ